MVVKGISEEDLHSKFLDLNRKYFGDCLPKKIKITKSKRMTRKAGACYFWNYMDRVEPIEIRLSEKYLQRYPFELDSVLLHEMIHMKLGNIGHAYDFVSEIERLKKDYGVKVRVKGLNLQYIYECSNCGKRYILEEELNTVFFICGLCGSKLVNKNLKG